MAVRGLYDGDPEGRNFYISLACYQINKTGGETLESAKQGVTAIRKDVSELETIENCQIMAHNCLYNDTCKVDIVIGLQIR
jgi:hypothetical protein